MNICGRNKQQLLIDSLGMLSGLVHSCTKFTKLSTWEKKLPIKTVCYVYYTWYTNKIQISE